MKWLLAIIGNHVSTHESLRTLNIKDERNGETALFRCFSCFFFIVDPFQLTLWSSGGEGEGSGFTLCMFGAHCPSKKSLKCSSGLQLFSISNRSNEQQRGLYLLMMCCVFFFFLSFSFTGWRLAKPYGSSLAIQQCSTHQHTFRHISLNVSTHAGWRCLFGQRTCKSTQFTLVLRFCLFL